MKVCVLLSAYNGDKFIREQIDSILNQKGVDISLFIRDDGSNDNTREILYSYGDRISFYFGKNIGVRASFTELVSKAPQADFYAFSDQDDFWLPDKLQTACEMTGLTQKPSLYFSNLYNADEKLNITSRTKLKPRLTLGAAMSQNPATGCTMVFNRSLCEIIKKTPNPDEISLHDTWVYRLALMVGANVYFDETPHILYRQHSSNLLGSRGVYKKLCRYARVFAKKEYNFSRPYEAEKLLEAFADLSEEKNILLLKDIINYKASFKNKLSLIKGGRLKTGSLFTDMLIAASVITGYF